MNYMITGCAGFIGSHMVDLILKTSDDNVRQHHQARVREDNLEEHTAE